MGFAYDKLYEEFIRPHMPEFVDKVKVREILPFLCCLTSSDQEEIWAQTDMRGNGAGMQVLLDCIRRRENWPEDLIQALKMRKHTTLANRMEEKYESLKAPHKYTAMSPQVSLVKPVQDTNSPKALGDAGAQEQVVKCTATFDQFDIKQAHQEEECRRQPVLLLQSLPGSSDWPNHSGSRGPSLCRSGPDAWEDECFSKPGVLRSVPPPSRMQAAVLEGPYSGDSARLQISSFSATLSNHNPGSVTPSHWGPRPKELEKNQYDPAPQGFDARRDVWENVVHVSEGAAVQNYAGQDPRTGEETPAGTLTENAHPLSPSPLGPGLQWLHGGQGAVPQISFLMAAAVTVLAVLVMLWSSV
ncbi:hypothetical protein MATL_G00192560 [Megalops atlanticus]|uniref:Caspase recruitment domain-containing protein n=1 Tax=Megalops atlanticus TaxID=7932 RepID=A0A9D3SYD3_MEGAT|nr:hypothetical protein MATL_G00192560 [Megalops atlanticus]